MTGTLRTMTSLYLTCGDRVLLLYREGSRVVNQVWIGAAGGHFEPQDHSDARACVLRELYEELSITEAQLLGLSLRYITLRRTPDEIRQNYYFFAELPDGFRLPLSSNEGTLRWFLEEELHCLPMPFTAKYVMQHWLITGKRNDRMYCGVADGKTVAFTELTEF